MTRWHGHFADPNAPYDTSTEDAKDDYEDEQVPTVEEWLENRRLRYIRVDRLLNKGWCVEIGDDKENFEESFGDTFTEAFRGAIRAWEAFHADSDTE
jgi:hypothetical protein